MEYGSYVRGANPGYVRIRERCQWTISRTCREKLKRAVAEETSVLPSTTRRPSSANLLAINSFFERTIPIEVTPIQVKTSGTTPCYTQAYKGSSQTGQSYTFRDYVADLSRVGFNDKICSVKQTGMWIYYEHHDYNKYSSGKVYWVHGVDIKVTFPRQNCGITSSLKYAGNRHYLNEDSYTVYSGEYFTGDEFYGNIDAADLRSVSGQSSSVIITGKNPWTFYSGNNYSGQGFCFFPSTDTDHGNDGTILNFGFYPSMKSMGVPDNYFRSARKGCYSRNIVRIQPMEGKSKQRNGAWGVFDV